ncbi:MAG: hypothetical protein OEZ02_12090 [Anaerolineae bacterium]|nr:hypothetical protein [Anaerolineae bacterium]
MFSKRFTAVTLFIFLSACSFHKPPAETTQAVPPSATTTIPTTVPTLFASPTVTLYPTPTPYPIPTIEAIVHPLPDLVVTFSHWPPYPEGICAGYSYGSGEELAEEPVEENITGEIWLLKYPYTTAELMLRDEKIGYFQPTWSPNGEQIAYIQVDKSSPGEQVPLFDRTFRFPQAYSLWVMQADGSGKRQVGNNFPMQESYMLGRLGAACVVASGFDIIGWSPDSQRVLVRQHLLGVDSPKLLLANTATGEISFIATLPEFNHYQWGNSVYREDIQFAPDGNTIAILDRDAVKLEIIEMKGDGWQTAGTFSLAERFGDNYLIHRIKWEQSGKGIMIIGKERGVNYKDQRPLEIWHLNISNHQLTHVAKLPISRGSFMGDWLISCHASREISTLIIVDIYSGRELGAVETNDWIDCNTLSTLKDSSGNELIAFSRSVDITLDDGKNSYRWNGLWVSSIYGYPPLLEPVFSDVNLFEGAKYGIDELAWRP